MSTNCVRCDGLQCQQGTGGIHLPAHHSRAGGVNCTSTHILTAAAVIDRPIEMSTSCSTGIEFKYSNQFFFDERETGTNQVNVRTCKSLFNVHDERNPCDLLGFSLHAFESCNGAVSQPPNLFAMPEIHNQSSWSPSSPIRHGISTTIWHLCLCRVSPGCFALWKNHLNSNESANRVHTLHEPARLEPPKFCSTFCLYSKLLQWSGEIFVFDVGVSNHYGRTDQFSLIMMVVS